MTITDNMLNKKSLFRRGYHRSVIFVICILVKRKFPLFPICDICTFKHKKKRKVTSFVLFFLCFTTKFSTPFLVYCTLIHTSFFDNNRQLLRQIFKPTFFPLRIYPVVLRKMQFVNWYLYHHSYKDVMLRVIESALLFSLITAKKNVNVSKPVVFCNIVMNVTWGTQAISSSHGSRWMSQHSSLQRHSSLTPISVYIFKEWPLRHWGQKLIQTDTVS